MYEGEGRKEGKGKRAKEEGKRNKRGKDTILLFMQAAYLVSVVAAAAGAGDAAAAGAGAGDPGAAALFL